MDRLKKLKTLERKLKKVMKDCDSKSLAGIAKQYRETIREIEEIEEGTNPDDEIAEILSGRKSDGKSGAVRKDRSGV